MIHEPIYTQDQMLAIGGFLWAGRTVTRVYFEDWPEMIGLRTEEWGTGGVYKAWLQGCEVPVRKATQFLLARVWWEDGRIHSDIGRRADGLGLPVLGDQLERDLADAVARRVAEVLAG